MVLTLSTLVDGLPFRARALAFPEGLAGFEVALERHYADRAIDVAVQHPVCRSDPTLVRRSSPLAAVPGAKAALSELFAASGLYINFFSSSQFGNAAGADATPALRLLASPAASEVEKAHLRSIAGALDPLELLTKIRALQRHLRILAAGFTPYGVRRDKAGGTRYWRTHRNAFESALPTLQSWQQDDPSQSSLKLLNRLRREQPGIYREGQLRSLQRQLKLLRDRLKPPS